ncbi:hypothetical protein [Kitasatospora cineracea]|uniref:hypothetical protein n=1 Tax=Kitasatospora cineracea TaxID=88074 RepID=UPI0033EE4DA9
MSWTVPQPFTVVYDWTERYQLDNYNESFPDRDAPVFLVWAADSGEASDVADAQATLKFGPAEFRELRHIVILKGHAYPVED